MKIKPLILLIIFLKIITTTSIYAQTSKIKIKLGSKSTTPLSCNARIKGDKYELIIPALLEPEATGSQSVSIRLEGNNAVFSFKIQSNTEVNCQLVPDGFDILFTSTSNGTTQNPISQPNPQVNNPPPQTSPTPPVTDIDLTASKAPTKELIKEAKKDSLDLSVPESPGFTILGLTPQTVVRPSSPREFAATVLNGLDENGNLQNGIAIDTAPYLLFFGNKKGVNLKNYRNLNSDNKPQFSLMRFASRIQFSLATTKGSSEDDKSARIGSGLHLTIFDYGDPRMDQELDDCFRDLTDDIERTAAINLHINPDPTQQTGPEQDQVVKEIERLVPSYREKYKKDCVEPSKKRNFARSSFIVGGAGSWISQTGESSKFKYNGSGIWTSLAYGFEGLPGLEKNAQLILHFRRRIKETVTDPLNQGKFITKDTNFFGMRLRFGVPNWTGNIEGVYQGEHFAGRQPENNFRLSFGSDYKLADNLYLNFSIGGETKKSNISDKKVFVRTSFNWGASQKALN